MFRIPGSKSKRMFLELLTFQKRFHGAQPRIFQGTGGFLECQHFDKNLIYKTWKKDPTGKNFRVFFPRTILSKSGKDRGNQPPPSPYSHTQKHTYTHMYARAPVSLSLVRYKFCLNKAFKVEFPFWAQ